MFKRRGFLLALAMLLIPVALLMVFSLTRVIFEETGMSMQAQKRTKAFFLCQAALSTASHLFSVAGNRGHTHEADGVTVTPADSLDSLQSYTLPDVTRDGDGWFSWHSDATHSYTRSGVDESYRFQIFLPQPGQFCIRVEGVLGGYVARQEQLGAVEGVYDYVIFDNGNTSDFSRAEQHVVEGKVHANGDIFMRPWTSDGLAFPPPPLPPIVTLINFQHPARLTIRSDKVTTAGKVVRSTDHLGNPDPGGYVKISQGNKTGPLIPLEGKNEGGFYDSTHGPWRSSGSDGAIARYGGVVVDSELGAVKRTPPARQALTPGGYYDSRAGMHINASSEDPTWCVDKTFYNQNEAREVTVKEIDVSKMPFPDNGLIYADVPVRLINAHKLPADMTLASASTIYTRGDFNKDDPDGGGAGRSHSASLMTTDRVYNLTSSFDDAKSYHYDDPIAAVLSGGIPEAEDAPLYAGDPEKVLEVNAGIMDGSPTNDVRAWANDEDNPYYISSNYHYFGKDTGTKEIPSGHDSANAGLKSAFPNPDDYLENLQGIKVLLRGSSVHNRNSTMAPGWKNDEVAAKPWLSAWIVKSGYIPPKQRDCLADPRLTERPPPGAPQAARKLLWREL